MTNVRILAPLLALLGFVGALVFAGGGRVLCLLVAVGASVAMLVLEVERRRTGRVT